MQICDNNFVVYFCASFQVAAAFAALLGAAAAVPLKAVSKAQVSKAAQNGTLETAASGWEEQGWEKPWQPKKSNPWQKEEEEEPWYVYCDCKLLTGDH